MHACFITLINICTFYYFDLYLHILFWNLCFVRMGSLNKRLYSLFYFSYCFVMTDSCSDQCVVHVCDKAAQKKSSTQAWCRAKRSGACTTKQVQHTLDIFLLSAFTKPTNTSRLNGHMRVVIDLVNQTWFSRILTWAHSRQMACVHCRWSIANTEKPPSVESDIISHRKINQDHRSVVVAVAHLLCQWVGVKILVCVAFRKWQTQEQIQVRER